MQSLFCSQKHQNCDKNLAENKIRIQYVLLVPLWDHLGSHFGPIKPTIVPFWRSSGDTLGVSGRSLAASGVHFRASASENPCYASTRARRNARSDPPPHRRRRVRSKSTNVLYMFPFSINFGFLHPSYNPPQGLRIPPGKCVRVRHGGFKMTFQALISPQIFRTFILLLFFTFFHDSPDFILFYGAIWPS